MQGAHEQDLKDFVGQVIKVKVLDKTQDRYPVAIPLHCKDASKAPKFILPKSYKRKLWNQGAYEVYIRVRRGRISGRPVLRGTILPIDEKRPLRGIFKRIAGKGFIQIDFKNRAAANIALIGKKPHSIKIDNEIETFIKPARDSKATAFNAHLVWNKNLPATQSTSVHELLISDNKKEIAQARNARKQTITTKDRVNLKHHDFVTMDGAGTQDFDDAVHCEPDLEPDNQDGMILRVAVADVAHYVPEGSPIDKRAKKIGVSHYSPNNAIHMCGKDMAEGVCALSPHKNRYAVVATIRITKNGEVLSTNFARAVIKSRAALTYTQVDDALQNGTKLRPDLQKIIEDLEKAYLLLRQQTAENELMLLKDKTVPCTDEQGILTHYESEPYGTARHMIEIFSVLTGKETWKTLNLHDANVITRHHAKPEVQDFQWVRERLAAINIFAPEHNNWSINDLNDIINRAKTDAERFVVNELILGTVPKGTYSINKLGHYGLGIDDENAYCQFTSPIRRYGDLVIHRTLIAVLGLGKNGRIATPEELKALCDQLNQAEDTAKDYQSKMGRAYIYTYLHRFTGQKIKAKIVNMGHQHLTLQFGDMPINESIRVPIDALPKGRIIYYKDTLCHYHETLQKSYAHGDIIDVIIDKSDPLTFDFSVRIDPEFNPKPEQPCSKQCARKSKNKKSSLHNNKTIKTLAKLNKVTTTGIDLTYKYKGVEHQVSLAPRAFYKGSFRSAIEGTGLFFYDPQKVVLAGEEWHVNLTVNIQTGDIMGVNPCEKVKKNTKPRQRRKSIPFHEGLRQLQIA